MVSDATSPQKKRKLGQKNSIHIHCLPDELLLEILCRLSCSEFAIQCKSVCKRWASLISSPLFLGWFIADKGKHQVFSTLVRVHRSRESKDTWKGMMIYLKDPVFNIDNLSSSSLPSFKDGNATALTVHASCKDLLLYYRDELGKQDYYICNVQTQQWLPLPALPCYHRSIYVAFTCDPYYLYGERKDNIRRDNIILDVGNYETSQLAMAVQNRNYNPGSLNSNSLSRFQTYPGFQQPNLQQSSQGGNYEMNQRIDNKRTYYCDHCKIHL